MKNVLFVCLGNTCRSPMAELLAQNHFSKADFHFESAGVYAKMGESISFFAAETLAIHHFILSDNFRSRNISQVNLAKFDTIIALDNAAAAIMEKEKKEHTTLILCDIEDPFAGSMAEYTLCMENILAALSQIQF